MKNINNYILEKLILKKDKLDLCIPKTMSELCNFIHKQVEKDPYSTAIEKVDLSKLKDHREFGDTTKNMVATIAMRYCILEILKKHFDKIIPNRNEYDIYNNKFELIKSKREDNIWDDLKEFQTIESEFYKIDCVTKVLHKNEHQAYQLYYIDIETLFGITFTLTIKTNFIPCQVKILDSEYITDDTSQKYDIRSYLT